MRLRRTALWSHVVLVWVLASLIVGYGARPGAATDVLFAKDKDLMDLATGYVFPSHDPKIWATHGNCRTTRKVVTIDTAGKVNTLATLPSRSNALKCEIDSIAYAATGLLVTQGTTIYLVTFSGSSVTQAAVIPPGSCGDSTGILADPFNLFGGFLLICESGDVYTWSGTGTPTFLTAVGVPVSIQGDVAHPATAGIGRRLIVHSALTNGLYAISPSGASLVATLPSALASGEGVVMVLHAKPYNAVSPNAGLFVVSTDGVRTFASVGLTPTGDILVSTAAGQIVRVSVNASGVFSFSSFHPNLPVRGAAFSPLHLIEIEVNTTNFPQGNATVDIFSTPNFNAPVEVLQSSLTFGVTGDEASWTFCNPTFHDRNGDGLLDLRCHFRMSAGGFTQPGQFAILRGRTINPIEFEGGD